MHATSPKTPTFKDKISIIFINYLFDFLIISQMMSVRSDMTYKHFLLRHHWHLWPLRNRCASQLHWSCQYGCETSATTGFSVAKSKVL
jgi:hypothetical protein